ncbi:hypothetical protein ACIRPK_01780 [Kitasatospora sp. NPDC101801]|uniref:hypothetical protein n=1 Tax=Kitasatospora sp. NPDC101801 TaxID=3364103 RepID=UPI00382F82FE
MELRTLIRRVTLGVAVVGSVAVGLFWWALLSLPGHAEPPDVTAMANAPATRAADQAAAELTDSQLGLLQARTPWAEQLGSSAADVCFSQSRSGSFGSGEHWDPVTCRRAGTSYLAFDGEIWQRLDDLDRTVAALGWTPDGGAWLTDADRHLQAPDSPVHPAATESAYPRKVPVRLYLSYTRMHTGPLTLTIDVLELPAAPATAGGRGSWADARSPGGLPYRNDSSARAVYFTWRPVDPSALLGSTPHHYVAAFSFDAKYYVEPSAHSAAPSAPPAGAPACHSGSGRCN